MGNQITKLVKYCFEMGGNFKGAKFPDQFPGNGG